MKMYKILLSIFMLIFIFNSCIVSKSSSNPDFAINIEKVCNEIENNLRKPSLKNYEIGVLTFVDLNNLDKAEPLGRYLQERVSYGLFKRGFRIVELRNSEQIFFEKNKGEFNLSRLKNELKDKTIESMKSVVVGTYTDAGNTIYVNIKLVELKTSLLRANAELKFKKGKFLENLYFYKTKNTKSKKKKNYKKVLERFETN